MTTWILAAVLLGFGAGLGYRQGAIRVAFALVGIITGLLLASTVGRMAAPLVRLLVKNIYLQEVAGPVLGFVAVLVIFKIVGGVMHKQVAGHYRELGDFKRGLWERLNMRLGLCLGLVNGLAYLVLASAAIYLGSYWSVQVSPPDTDVTAARVLNLMGRDLQATGMAKVAESASQVPEAYYQAADVAGLVINNPAVESRLARYPAFISLAQMPELQGLANDDSFNQLMSRKASLAELLKHPGVKAILDNPAVVKEIQNAVAPNLADLTNFLVTGESVTYGREPILGRWVFDLQATVADYRREKPSMPSAEIAKVRALMDARYAKATVAAGTDQRIFLLNFPKPNAGQLETYQAQWSNAGGE